MSIRYFTGSGLIDTALLISAADYSFNQFWRITSAVDMGWKNKVHVRGFWTTDLGQNVTHTNGTSTVYVRPSPSPAVFMTVGSGGHHYVIPHTNDYEDTTPPPQLNISAPFYVQKDYGEIHIRGFWTTDLGQNVTHTNGTHPRSFEYGEEEVDYSPGRVQSSTRAGQTSYLLYPRTDVEVDVISDVSLQPAEFNFGGSTNTLKLSNSISLQRTKRITGIDARGESYGLQSVKLYPRGSKPLFRL